MNGFATTIISALLLVVAFMQWRTAHQKAVLDLFDKRFKVYDLVGRAMDIFYSASPLDTFIEARLLLQAASLEARFLFGPEISEHISSINRDIADLTFKLRKKDAADLDYTARNKLIDEIVIIDERIHNWQEPFTVSCMPYLRTDQKIIRTPMQWFRDRNALRLGYADDT